MTVDVPRVFLVRIRVVNGTRAPGLPLLPHRAAELDGRVLAVAANCAELVVELRQ